jgi:hypothetical protein
MEKIALSCVEKVNQALDDILTSHSVAELPNVIAPSADDFDSEEAYQQELDYIASDIACVEVDIRSALSALAFLDDNEKKLFRLMAWQHIDRKRFYTHNFPSLHPENILRSRD